MLPTPRKRLLALAAGALLLGSPLLSSCGFGVATSQINNPVSGVNYRSGSVDILGAAIVAGQDGLGNFIASLANNLPDTPQTLVSLTPAGNSGFLVDDVTPVQINPRGFVNLANPEVNPAQDIGGPGEPAAAVGTPIRVSGAQIVAGRFVMVTLGFASGDEVTLNVPIYTDCDFYSGLAPSGVPSTAASPTLPPSPSGSSTPAPGQAKYDCSPDPLPTELQPAVNG